MANNLYYCRIKVTRAADSEIPENIEGAYVPSFAVAEDHQKALGLIIPGLQAVGWVFAELVSNRVDEMEWEHWDDFMAATWPELRGELPDQAAIAKMIETGGAFYGPPSLWGSAPAT